MQGKGHEKLMVTKWVITQVVHNICEHYLEHKQCSYSPEEKEGR